MTSSSAAVLKTKSHAQDINTGLAPDYRDEMTGLLTEILAATYKLTIKSHVYHWNVVGPLFKPLHELTEEHYNALFAATDVIAERIRSLGHLAPEKFGDASNFAPDGKSLNHKTAESMVEDLVKDHEAAVRAMREAGEKAGDAGDLVTEDMLTQFLAFHEKAIWMLRAHVA